MSVAQGIAQPRCSSGAASAATAPVYISAGTSIPPAAANSGTAASRHDARAPPGWVASTISLVASAKKNTIAMSLTAK